MKVARALAAAANGMDLRPERLRAMARTLTPQPAATQPAATQPAATQPAATADPRHTRDAAANRAAPRARSPAAAQSEETNRLAVASAHRLLTRTIAMLK